MEGFDSAPVPAPSRRRFSWFPAFLLLAFGGVTVPMAYEKASALYFQGREWVLMRAIESDLEGKEIVIDLRSQKKSQAKGMSKDDVLKAFWVSELRRSQVEHVLGMVRENVQWDPYINYEEEK